MNQFDIRKIENYLERKQKKTRLEGDKVCCEKCGSIYNLEWHHKIPLSDGGNNHTENLEVLCKICHQNIHSTKEDFKRWGYFGGKVSAYLREQRAGSREQFCNDMKELAKKRWSHNKKE